MERRTGLTRAAFREFVEGAGRPVIVADSAEAWPVPHTWTFGRLASAYGQERVVATTNLISYENSRRVRLSDFLLYCQAPALSPLNNAAPAGTPLYVSFPIRQKFPQLMEGFSLPAFLDTCYAQLEGGLREWYYDTFAWIYIGPKNTVTPLHVDHFMTHTISAQVAGKKKFLLFSPDILERLPEPGSSAGRDVFRTAGPNPAAPLAVHEALVSEGEMLMFPAGWAHHVIALEPSISVSVNFVDSSNVLAHLMMISRQLPAWARRINTAAFRSGNRCEWSSKNFAGLDTAAC